MPRLWQTRPREGEVLEVTSELAPSRTKKRVQGVEEDEVPQLGGMIPLCAIETMNVSKSSSSGNPSKFIEDFPEIKIQNK